jgi:tRNA (cytidine/uridine-2'-O-)-methyltransferase
MLSIVLFEPEIPPNTGNIIRLAANTGCQLHLIRPLGFPLDSKKMRRAGLDYHEFAQLQVHDNWLTCCEALQGKRFFAVTTKGTQQYHTVCYQPDDVFVFGPETRGLPAPIRQTFPAEQQLRLPMLPHSRSLNLSNAVAIVIYHAWQQLGFPEAV